MKGLEMFNKNAVSIMCVAVLLTVGGTATADVIDGFRSADPGDGWLFDLGTPGGTETEVQTYSESGLAGVLGASRDWTFTSDPWTWSGNTSTHGNRAWMRPDWVSPSDPSRVGFFQSDGDPPPSGRATIEALYDGGGAGLNLDFSQAGDLVLEYFTDHRGAASPTVISLTLSDSSGPQTISHTYDSYEIVATFVDEIWTLSDFGSIDLTDIQSIVMTYQKDAAANDIAWDVIGTTGPIIPEPTTLALLGLSGLMLLRRRR